MPPDDDTISLNVTTDPAVSRDLGAGDDLVLVSAAAAVQVRLTFTSAEVGNGNPNDAGTLANQDGGLAVRLRAEDGLGALTGPTSRFDDEGITFTSATAGLTFDVRDLTSGVERGNLFETVRLGTSAGDVFGPNNLIIPAYVNAGGGNDTVTGGRVADFLVGGVGDDLLIGARGNDTILGGAGNDTVNFAIARHGADSVDGGAGDDVVNVSVDAPGQIRLTFTSAEVGNGLASDAGTLANQDGGLAVRMQLEGAGDALTGDVSRFDDEGITFVARNGATFDVRDLTSGVQRGNLFETVRLGTSTGDVFGPANPIIPAYVNAGGGNDTVTGGRGADFLVGGVGDDLLIGGVGNDTILGGAGNDTINFAISRYGADSVDGGAGDDVVVVRPDAPGQIRLTFTSAEVGNGLANDAGTLANQDGGLAVRMQLEGAGDALTGDVSRFDDEGITFVARNGATFDVRDLTSGVQRGNLFQVAQLGTSADDVINQTGETLAYYVNAGGGNDDVRGGRRNDFLVGGVGDDTILGSFGTDSLLGGGGFDAFVFDTAPSAGNADTIVDYNVADDTIQLDNLVFIGLAEGALDAEAFAFSTDAAEFDDRIIYDAATGALSFDADGGDRSDAVNFAVLATRPANLSADDVFIG